MDIEEAIVYALRKTKGKPNFKDRSNFLEEMEVDQDDLIRKGIIDCNLFASRE